MCLFTNQILPRRATKDIEVQKHLIWRLSVQKLQTPHLDVVVNKKEMSCINFQKIPSSEHENILCISSSGAKTPYTVDFAIHSYNINLDTGYIFRSNCRVDVIIKAIIPKGTRYYTSFDKTEFASEKLVLTSKVIKFYHRDLYEVEQLVRKLLEDLK